MAFDAPEGDLLAPTGAMTAFGDAVLGASVPGAHQAKSLSDAIVAGLQNSATGLALRGELPSQQLDENAPWYHRLAAGAFNIAADLPLSAVGAAGGGVAGTAVAGPAGTVVGMGAGAFAAPMALRDALIEAYGHNHAASWEGAWEIAKAAMKGGTKGALIGGVTAGAGKVVAPLLEPLGKAAVAAGTTGAELTALTTTAAALEGRMPTGQDFMDNAIMLVGMKGAVHIATAGLRNIYAETGRTPDQVRSDAAKDPSIKEQLQTSTGPDIIEAYKGAALQERITAAIDADPRPEMIRKALTGEPIPKLGEPPIADPVKYEYITDTDTAKGVLRRVTDLYSAEMEGQTRGVVTNKATAVEALKAVAGGTISEHVVGEAGNAAEIYARAHILKGATNEAVRQLQKIAGIPEADLSPAMKLEALASIERVSMLKAEIEGVGAEAGRALQIFRAIKRDPSFLGEADSLLAIAERKGKLQDIASLVASFKDPAQMAGFAREYTQATTLQKVLYAWRSFILSGPQTHLANVSGNLMKWGIEVPESMFAATYTAAARALKGDPLTMEQYKARAFAPIYGLQLGSREALYAAAEVWRGKGERVEKADVYQRPIEGKVGAVLELPFKALQVEDVMFRTVAERSEAYKMAIDRATKEGWSLSTEEGRQRITAYTERPDFGLSAKAGAEAVARVQNAGAEAVFSQRLGPFLEMTQAAIQRHAPLLSFIVPFIRTPANLVSWAVQHVPGLNLMSGRWRADFAAGGEPRARAVARVVIGTGIAVTAYSMAQEGTLTGGGMFDKEEGATKRAAGWQPYSLKIGDKYYSYQRIEPVSKVLGIAADLVELQARSEKEEDKAKIAALMVMMFGNATVSTTYLSGLSNAIQSVTDPERHAGNFLNQYASSVVPKIVGQSADATDPHRREVDGIMAAIQSQIPFLREKLLPKRDVWGEPVENGRWFGVMPVATSEASHDKVRTEAARLHVAIADAPKFLMEKGPFNPKDKRAELKPEQRDIIKEVTGKNAMAILGPIVNAPDWEQIPDFAKAEIYKHVLEGTRKQGMYAAVPPDDAAREALRQKIVDRIIKETQQAEGNKKPAAQERERRVR